MDDQIARLNQGRAASLAKEILGDVLREQSEHVERQVFEILREGRTLDPGFAVQAWLARYAFAQVERALTRKERAGMAASKRLAPNMTP